MLSRLGQTYATAFLRQLPRSATRIKRVTVADEQRALAIIFHYADKGFSLTDATSFAVMERLGSRMPWRLTAISPNTG